MTANYCRRVVFIGVLALCSCDSSKTEAPAPAKAASTTAAAIPAQRVPESAMPAAGQPKLNVRQRLARLNALKEKIIRQDLKNDEAVKLLDEIVASRSKMSQLIEVELRGLPGGVRALEDFQSAQKAVLDYRNTIDLKAPTSEQSSKLAQLNRTLAESQWALNPLRRQAAKRPDTARQIKELTAANAPKWERINEILKANGHAATLDTENELKKRLRPGKAAKKKEPAAPAGNN